jgi:hypothetical protein
MPVVAVAFAVDGQWTAVGSGELTPAACASSETPAHFSLASVRGRVSLMWRAYRPVDPAALDDEIVVGADRLIAQMRSAASATVDPSARFPSGLARLSRAWSCRTSGPCGSGQCSLRSSMTESLREAHREEWRLERANAGCEILCRLNRGGRMSRGAATHGHARAMERLADCGKMTAQLRTDLAQGPTLCIRVGRTFNVHGVTVAAVRLDVASRDQVAISPGRRVAGSRTGICWTVAYADTRLDGVSAWGELALLIACLVVAGSILIALQANAAGAIQFRKIQYDPVGSDVPATNSPAQRGVRDDQEHRHDYSDIKGLDGA